MSPKAIFVKESFITIRNGDVGPCVVNDYPLPIKNKDGNQISGNAVVLPKPLLLPDRFGTGDFFVLFESGLRRRILANTEDLNPHRTSVE